MRIENIEAAKDKHDYGDTVVFDNGYLSINLFDGHTELNKAEAKKLGQALLEWADV